MLERPLDVHLIAATLALVPRVVNAAADPAPPPPDLHAERMTLRPNLPLLGAGATTFAVGYVPALAIAGISDHEGDNRLYIPVAGPWLDLLERTCDAGETVACGCTAAEATALVFDGFVQTVGALEMLAALFDPEERMLVERDGRRPEVRVVPASLGGRGYGFWVAGGF
jgi:hypothetical protein